MATINHEEVTRQLSYSRRQRLDLFRRINNAEQGTVLLRLSPRVQAYIIERLSDDELVELLNYLDSQQTTRLLRRTSSKRADELLGRLSENVRNKAEYLLRFNPRAAAGLMNLNYVAVQEDVTFRDVSQILQTEEHATGQFPTILVLDGAKLVGELPGHELVLSRPNQHILTKVKKVPTLAYDSTERFVVQTFLRHPHGKIVVTDEARAIIGVINTDDIIPLIQDRSAGGLYKFAGVTREEDAYDSPLVKVKYRYKWLIINLGTAFLAASVVSLFEGTISKFVLLAIYMPIVAGMGGNAGTQALAVAIRGLALKEVDIHTARRFVINEMIAGGINGLINGAIVAAVAVFFNHSAMLGVVLALAMVINLIVAGMAGAFIPLIMKRLGKDPASSATIFITTATDVCGFFVFLGLATILLG
jgi:magnesium transporter